jgi:hypothetical protein
MHEPQFIRSTRYELYYIWREVRLRIKHPGRPGDFKYHCSKLWDEVAGHPWYCLKRGVRNLVHYFPIVWGTDVYDHTYLTELMDKKLEELEKFWKKKADEERAHMANDNEWKMEKGWRCQYRRIYKRIAWCRRLQAMWGEEYYAMKHYDYHRTKFPGSDRFMEDSTVTEWDKWGEPLLYRCAPMPEDEREDYRFGSDDAHKMDAKVFKLWHKQLGFVQHWWH